jgi:hypothetical protein
MIWAGGDKPARVNGATHVMDAAQVQTIFRERLGLRIGPAVAEYVLSRVASGQDSPMPLGAIPVIASDSRTGAPVRRVVDLSEVDARSPDSASRLASEAAKWEVDSSLAPEL